MKETEIPNAGAPDGAEEKRKQQKRQEKSSQKRKGGQLKLPAGN
jgi:hypothetical protein